MPLSPTVPVAQSSLTTFVITQVLINVDPSITVTLWYAPSDGSGNPQGVATAVVLGAPALATYTSTGGSIKAKLYAALQTQVPALAGSVT